MKRLEASRFINDMSRQHAPAYSIEPGESVIVATLDCEGGRIGRDGKRLPGPPCPNPATGPIEIMGAEAGEALAVNIQKIVPADWGYIGGGGDKSNYTIIDLKDGCAVYPWGLRLPMNPMLGVIGLAPAGEPVPTITPGNHGGNLDTPEVCAGAVVFLPVAVAGGMLALGDAHALQGDGETGGTGIECQAEVTLSVARVRRPLTDVPYILHGDRLILVGSGEDLDEAARLAVEKMAKLLRDLLDISEVLARRFFSTAGDLRISQIVNPLRTCRAVVSKAALGKAWPFPDVSPK
jgi:amidase